MCYTERGRLLAPLKDSWRVGKCLPAQALKFWDMYAVWSKGRRVLLLNCGLALPPRASPLSSFSFDALFEVYPMKTEL